MCASSLVHTCVRSWVHAHGLALPSPHVCTLTRKLGESPPKFKCAVEITTGDPLPFLQEDYPTWRWNTIISSKVPSDNLMMIFAKMVWSWLCSKPGRWVHTQVQRRLEGVGCIQWHSEEWVSAIKRFHCKVHVHNEHAHHSLLFLLLLIVLVPLLLLTLLLLLLLLVPLPPTVLLLLSLSLCSAAIGTNISNVEWNRLLSPKRFQQEVLSTSWTA